jgi:hypothetical protein
LGAFFCPSEARGTRVLPIKYFLKNDTLFSAIFTGLAGIFIGANRAKQGVWVGYPCARTLRALIAAKRTGASGRRKAGLQKDEDRMTRIAMLLAVAVLAAPFNLSSPAEAQTAPQSGAKPKSATSHIVPMHPHQLTLYPHGRPQRRHSAYSFNRHHFDQPTPIHNTFMGPRYY